MISPFGRNAGPDNTAIVARELARRERNHRRTGPLGEYVQDLPYRVFQPQGSVGAEMGPLTAPAVLGPESGLTELDYLQMILDEIRRMPENMSYEWRRVFPMQPRESISFVVSSTSVNVPAGTAVAVATQLIPERYTGFLTRVGVNVTPGASFPNIIWQVRINGTVHPEFANRIFFANTLANPYRFLFELTQARTVQLVAINTSGAAILVQGMMEGWSEYMSDFKGYGSSPATGIA